MAKLTNLLIEYGIIAVFALSIAVLAAISVIHPDTAMITENPGKFALETFVVGVVPAVTLTIFMYTRNVAIQNIYKWVLILALKFSAIHILFQTSGFYTYFLGA